MAAQPSGFRVYCSDLIQRVEGAGWQIESEQTIPYGRMARVSQGGAKATLSCYFGKKGFKFVVAGKDADALGTVLGGGTPKQTSSATAGGDDPFDGGLPRVGADESGKGDYFGPLVVAAFYIDVETFAALKSIGVRDSKLLSRPQALRMAGEIDKLGRGAVLSLLPPDYNERYREVGNVNLLLAQMHGQCITTLIRTAQAENWAAPAAVVVDRFATNERPLRHEIKSRTPLITAPRAEADLCVAAASILARAAYLEALKDLESDFGTPFPPGAGTPTIQAGHKYVASYGFDALLQVAKTHFKTTLKYQ